MQYSLVKRVFPKWKEALENTVQIPEPEPEPEKSNVELVESIQAPSQILQQPSLTLPLPQRTLEEESICSVYITHVMSCEACKSRLGLMMKESGSMSMNDLFDSILPYLIIIFLLLVIFNASD